MANETTAFQNEVMFWQGKMGGENGQVDDAVKDLALSPEMGDIVETICRMLGDSYAVMGDDGAKKPAFKVWRNGLCFDLARNLCGLGRSKPLSEMLYDDNKGLRALQYRGVLEGFKILRHASSRGGSCTNLRSYVIEFVPPDE